MVRVHTLCANDDMVQDLDIKKLHASSKRVGIYCPWLQKCGIDDGQLTQLVGFDPTPRAIAHEVSPRTVAWVDHMDDQSGLEPQESDWLSLENQPHSLRGLMDEIGRVYAPAQLANARAVQAGEKTWVAEIDGVPWTQQTFPYQAKCLKWTNERYQALSEDDRALVDGLLQGTGVEMMLSSSAT